MNQPLGAKLAAIVTLICVFALPVAAANSRYLRVAAGDAASGLFDLTTAITKAVSGAEGSQKCRAALSCADIGLQGVVQSSVSSEAALTKLRSNVVDAVIVPDLLAFAAYKGSGVRRDAPWPQLRAIASVAVMPVFIVVRSESAIHNISGLAGLRVALGPRNADISASLASLLSGFGLLANQYTAVPVDTRSNALDLLTGNKVDAVLLRAAELPASVRSAILSGQVKLIGPSKVELERLTTAYPFITQKVVEVGNGDRYAAFCLGSVILTRADVPTPVVQTMLNRLWLKAENAKQFNRAQAVINLPAPLHSGAISFYQDNKPTETERAAP